MKVKLFPLFDVSFLSGRFISLRRSQNTQNLNISKSGCIFKNYKNEKWKFGQEIWYSFVILF